MGLSTSLAPKSSLESTATTTVLSLATESVSSTAWTGPCTVVVVLVVVVVVVVAAVVVVVIALVVVVGVLVVVGFGADGLLSGTVDVVASESVVDGALKLVEPGDVVGASSSSTASSPRSEDSAATSATWRSAAAVSISGKGSTAAIPPLAAATVTAPAATNPVVDEANVVAGACRISGRCEVHPIGPSTQLVRPSEILQEGPDQVGIELRSRVLEQLGASLLGGSGGL